MSLRAVAGRLAVVAAVGSKPTALQAPLPIAAELGLVLATQGYVAVVSAHVVVGRAVLPVVTEACATLAVVVRASPSLIAAEEVIYEAQVPLAGVA